MGLMAEKLYALDLNNEEWISLLTEKLGEPKFRADQICQWLWQKHTFDAEGMTNLSKALREKLPEAVDFGAPILVKEQRSKDGTRKFLWQVRDGNSIESVLLKQGDRLTACISTQIGCPLACTFCATGLSGFVRNLSAGEIAGQFLAMEKMLGRDINNIVFMGMGEPLLNQEAVFKSIRMLNDPKMRNLGIRHMTLSTSGVIPGINALAESGLGVRLAVSLHAVDNDLRSRLMPVNETYPVSELRKAMQEYQQTTGDRITIEYTLFGGINDSVEHARALVRYLKGIHVYVNLIPFNSVDERYDQPDAQAILKFRTVLETAGFECDIRQEQGGDIDAACGQLRRKTMQGESLGLEPKHDIRTTKQFHAEKEEREERAARLRTQRKNTHAPQKSFDNKRAGSKRTGGYIAERGSKKKDMPEKERYRSGKLKEARPTYIAKEERTERGEKMTRYGRGRTAPELDEQPKRGSRGRYTKQREEFSESPKKQTRGKFVKEREELGGHEERKTKRSFGKFEKFDKFEKQTRQARPKKSAAPKRGPSERQEHGAAYGGVDSSKRKPYIKSTKKFVKKSAPRQQKKARGK